MYKISGKDETNIPPGLPQNLKVRVKKRYAKRAQSIGGYRKCVDSLYSVTEKEKCAELSLLSCKEDATPKDHPRYNVLIKELVDKMAIKHSARPLNSAQNHLNKPSSHGFYDTMHHEENFKS